jgi:hypothetical protein
MQAKVASFRPIWFRGEAGFKRGVGSGKWVSEFREPFGRWPSGWRKSMGSVAPPGRSALITTA